MKAHIQERQVGWRVVIAEPANNKLVLAGEPLKRKIDATNVRDELIGDTIELGDDLPQHYKFTKNSGPKKKKK